MGIGVIEILVSQGFLGLLVLLLIVVGTFFLFRWYVAQYSNQDDIDDIRELYGKKFDELVTQLTSLTGAMQDMNELHRELIHKQDIRTENHEVRITMLEEEVREERKNKTQRG